MLQAKTEEHKNRVNEIFEKYFPDQKAAPWAYANNNGVTIYVPYDDGYDEECIDVPFDMMAEIVDYLRKENMKPMEKKITLWAGRLGRGGYLDLFVDKPQKDKSEMLWIEGVMFGTIVPSFMPEITSENSPVEVELTIKVK